MSDNQVYRLDTSAKLELAIRDMGQHNIMSKHPSGVLVLTSPSDYSRIEMFPVTTRTGRFYGWRLRLYDAYGQRCETRVYLDMQVEMILHTVNQWMG